MSPSKKGRQAKKKKAAKARIKAKARAAKAQKSCHFCNESERHLRRLRVTLDAKEEVAWRLCRSCTAVTMVMLRDPRTKKGH